MPIITVDGKIVKVNGKAISSAYHKDTFSDNDVVCIDPSYQWCEYTATEPITNITIGIPTDTNEGWFTFSTTSDTTATVTINFTRAVDGQIVDPADDDYVKRYLWKLPNFLPNETWEMNIKNGVIIARKVVTA